MTLLRQGPPEAREPEHRLVVREDPRGRVDIQVAAVGRQREDAAEHERHERDSHREDHDEGDEEPDEPAALHHRSDLRVSRISTTVASMITPNTTYASTAARPIWNSTKPVWKA